MQCVFKTVLVLPLALVCLFFFWFFFRFLFFFFVLMSSVIHFFQIQLKSFAIDPGPKGLLFQNIWHCYHALHLDSRRCTQNTKPRDNVGIAMPLARIGPIRLKRRVFSLRCSHSGFAMKRVSNGPNSWAILFSLPPSPKQMYKAAHA